MKTFVKPIVAGLLASSSFLMNPVLASDKSPVNFHIMNGVTAYDKESFTIELRRMSNSETIRAIIAKPEGKRVSVTLKDPNGLSLYNFFTESKSNRVGKDFNFSDAEQGIYTLEVSDGKTKVIKQIKLQRTETVQETKLTVE
jgi:hypothetical protein